MERPINKQAALGLSYGPGERGFSESEPTELNPQALRTRPDSVVQLQKAEERTETKHRDFEEAAKRHGFPLPPDDHAGRIAWAAEIKRCVGSIKLKDERSFMLLLFWVREILGREGGNMKVSVEIKGRRKPVVRH